LVWIGVPVGVITVPAPAVEDGRTVLIRKYWVVSGRLRSVLKPIRPILVLSFGFHSMPPEPDHTLPTFMRVY
jgi:hypothetical protein